MQRQRNKDRYKRKGRAGRTILLVVYTMVLSVGALLGRETGMAISGPIDCYYNVEHYRYLDNAAVRLKDCRYAFLDEVEIPGMPETKNRDFLHRFIYSIAQVPQGLCIAGDYLLVTAYSSERSCKGELMVIDRKSGEFLATLGMDEDSHLGGVAYDGSNVWVCNSSNRTLERISFDFISLMARENRKDVIDATDMVDEFAVENDPSCITWYGGRLWVATHTKVFTSRMTAYILSGDGKELKALSEYTIPPRVQGLVFDEEGAVYMSTSYGRKKSSYLRKYSSLIDMATNPDAPEKEVEMPPCSEEIDQENGCLYVIFESAGEKYYEGTDGLGICTAPLDKILEIQSIP